ncbi:hypothetical protein [Pseudobythopirellula maris]|uniref:hypothetical protein n=1 Tax=Pseudobythopirellula maris TaxID=2527991 RepID=UPI0011B743D4|nr:hypothetical protein [Pseudobythopirellula maris]
MSRAPRVAPLAALANCFAVYVIYHTLRPRLEDGLLRASLPSLLLPIAMVATVDLTPQIRFRSAKSRAMILTAMTAAAALWFEAVVPQLTNSSTGDWRDAAAMMAGLVIGLLVLRPKAAPVD